jgi:hypothetical protein
VFILDLFSVRCRLAIELRQNHHLHEVTTMSNRHLVTKLNRSEAIASVVETVLCMKTLHNVIDHHYKCESRVDCPS